MAKSLAELISELSPEEQEIALAGVDMDTLVWDWDFYGRPEQIPPKDDSWEVGLFMAGRGAGKTRSAAEWIRHKAKDDSQGPLRFLLVARTAADVREVIVEGEALALDTLVATPTGFSKINDLSPGDWVIGGDGKPCQVTKVHPILHNRPTYDVNISGTHVIADGNHKWLTTSTTRPTASVVTTFEMLNTVFDQHITSPGHVVNSITPIESVPVRCIEVDSDDHTFLITDQYIRTHNSGILSVSPPDEMPDYKPSIRRLVWPNGNQAFCTSADEPDSLRGVQAHYSWGDEVAAWRQTPDGAGMTAWDNLRVATRLGKNPQVLATTTPKRVKILFDLIEEQKKGGKIWITRGSTFDNAGNLAGSYLTSIQGVYGGTDQAKQELYGEMLEAAEGALWTDEVINNGRITSLPPYMPLRLIGVDPSVAENPGDYCGIVVVGSTAEPDLFKRHAWVMEDASLKAAPHVWAAEVVRMAKKYDCPVVAETNQGGALVANAIHQIDPSVIVLPVHAKVGKKLRAEPIGLIYQQERVHHVNRLQELENEMVQWVPEVSKNSPDRVDALVHALTALLVEPPPGFTGGSLRAGTHVDRRITTRTSTSPRVFNTRGKNGPAANSGNAFRIR